MRIVTDGKEEVTETLTLTEDSKVVTCTLRDASPSCLIFTVDANKPWFIRMSAEKGVEFNREDFPDALPNDFAKAFMEILERKFDIRFESKCE